MFGSFDEPQSLLLHVTPHEDYLDRWRGVLARIASVVAVRES